MMNINLRDAALQDAIKESVAETLDKSATELRVYSRRVADNAVAAATENISRQAARQIADEVEGLLNSKPTPETQYQEGVRDGINFALRTVENFRKAAPATPTGEVRQTTSPSLLGLYIDNAIHILLREAEETGDTVTAQFNGVLLDVSPWDTVEFARFRWRLRRRLDCLGRGVITQQDLIEEFAGESSAY